MRRLNPRKVGVFAAAAAVTASLAMIGQLGAGVAHAGTADNANGVSIDVGGNGDSTFVADNFGTGGVVDVKPANSPSLPNFAATVAHPIPAAIWNTSRFTESSYSVPGLTPGATYQLRLYFMDWFFHQPGQRVFDVAVDGTKVLTDFDIVGTAVAHGADGQEAFGVEKDVTVKVPNDGTVSVDFLRGTADQPQVNAIVVTPAAS